MYDNYQCPNCQNIYPKNDYFLHTKICGNKIRPTSAQILNTNNNYITIPTTNATYLNNYNTTNPNIILTPQQPVQSQTKTILYRPQTSTYYNINQPYNYSQLIQTQIQNPQIKVQQSLFKCNICGETMSEATKNDHLFSHKLDQENKDLLQAQRLQDEDIFNNISPEEVEQQRKIEEHIKRQQRQRQNNNNFISNDFNMDDMSMGIGNMGNFNGMPSMRNMNGFPNISIRRGGNNMGNLNNLTSGMGSPDFFRNFFNGMNNGFGNGSGFRRIIIPMGGMGGQMGDGDLNELIERMLHYSRENPTDAAIVSELPETKIDDINKLDNDKKNCVICMEDFKNGDKSTNLPCLHMFHTNCIQSWLKTQNTCPICKFKLTPENINNINRRG